jgi:flagellar motor protein MotB
MRLTALTVAGYTSGQTAFDPMFASVGLVERQQLLGVVQRIADGIADPAKGQLTSVVVVGHSDRQDLPSMSCDERRASEIAAARDRAVSAWDWVKARVTERLTVSGVDAGDWWETAPSITWSLVFAAAGMLQHDPPTPDERPLNRRVEFLVTLFDPS